MRRFLLVLVYSCLLCTTTFAQNSFPAGSEKLFSDVMKSINTRHSSWVKTKGKEVYEKNLSETETRSMVTQYAVLGNLSSADIEAICFLVLMQAAKSAQEDLKAIMAKVKSINDKKRQIRDAESRLNKSERITRAQLDSFRLLTRPDMPVAKLNTSPKTEPVTTEEVSNLKENIKKTLEGMNKMSESESLRQQKAAERQSTLIEILSHILDKMSKTASEIAKNLR